LIFVFENCVNHGCFLLDADECGHLHRTQVQV
jgi:hypothetical protein